MSNHLNYANKKSDSNESLFFSSKTQIIELVDLVAQEQYGYQKSQRIRDGS